MGILWRHRRITLGGLAIGAILALLAAYELPGFERRGSEIWSSTSNVMITQPGFPEGRIALPGSTVSGGATATGSGTQPFADPTRFSSLALLYSVIADSDIVRAKIAGDPAREQIEAVAHDATGTGTFLPIIQLTTRAGSAEAARRLNGDAFAAFRDLLESQQVENRIPPKGRVRLTVLNQPSPPQVVSGPTYTGALVVLLLTALAVLAATHVAEALSLRRRPPAALAPERPRGAEPNGRPDEPLELAGHARLREP